MLGASPQECISIGFLSSEYSLKTVTGRRSNPTAILVSYGSTDFTPALIRFLANAIQ